MNRLNSYKQEKLIVRTESVPCHKSTVRLLDKKSKKGICKVLAKRAILTSGVIIKLGDRSELEIVADVEFVK